MSPVYFDGILQQLQRVPKNIDVQSGPPCGTSAKAIMRLWSACHGGTSQILSALPVGSVGNMGRAVEFGANLS